jgi:hypothetical protein
MMTLQGQTVPDLNCKKLNRFAITAEIAIVLSIYLTPLDDLSSQQKLKEADKCTSCISVSS